MVDAAPLAKAPPARGRRPFFVWCAALAVVAAFGWGLFANAGGAGDMRTQLAHKRVVVCGASQGIGKEIALEVG